MYVICHMTTSIDGKVTGEFLGNPESIEACSYYYRIHRELQGDAFACGRVTMETSFTDERKIDVDDFEDVEELTDYVADCNAPFYAVSFDRKAKVGWTDSRIIDEDPGYDNSHVIEVVSKNANRKMLKYYQSIGVSYIVVESIRETLEKLEKYFDIHTLLLEGGSILNSSFLEENLIDELSLVISPVTGDGKPLFEKGGLKAFELNKIIKYKHSIVCLKYKKFK